MSSLVASVGFVWLGMVLAISFLETPLKFRAPGVSLRVGLAIGRVVFRAFNRVELGLCAVLVVAVALGPHRVVPVAAVGTVAVALAVQLLVVRPPAQPPVRPRAGQGGPAPLPRALRVRGAGAGQARRARRRRRRRAGRLSPSGRGDRRSAVASGAG